MKAKKKKIKASEFDEKFDRGEDISEHLDLSQSIKRVNVDFPEWSVTALDKEAERLGIARQALINIWIIERLDTIFKNKGKMVG